MLNATRALATLDQLTPLDRMLVGFLARYEGLTRSQYEYLLKGWLDWCGDHGLDPVKVERVHLELYIRYLSEVRGNKPSTIGSKMAPICGMYREAARDGMLDRDPAAYLRLPKIHLERKAPLEREQLRALRRAGRELGGRHWAVSELLVVHALRIGEIVGVQIENFTELDRGHRVLKFRRKGGGVSRIPLPIPTLMAMEDAAGDRTQGSLIVTRAGTPMGRGTAVGLLRTIQRHAKLERAFGPHLVRASVITYALEEGMSIREAQWLAGHQDPRTTSRHYDLGQTNHDRHPSHVLSARLTA